jgi:transcription termination factor NusB
MKKFEEFINESNFNNCIVHVFFSILSSNENDEAKNIEDFMDKVIKDGKGIFIKQNDSTKPTEKYEAFVNPFKDEVDAKTYLRKVLAEYVEIWNYDMVPISDKNALINLLLK